MYKKIVKKYTIIVLIINLIGDIVYKVIMLLLGFILTTIGLFYIILYTSLFNFFYDFKELILFLLRHIECYTFILGILITCFSVFIRRNKK